MQAKDWNLMVIASARQPLSPVQLQKALFLIGQELSPNERKSVTFYKFRPYDYGPFCSEIYRDADRLQAERLISIQSEPDRVRHYGAAEPGNRRAKELRGHLDKVALDYLDRVVAWVQSLPFDSLVGAIYKAYPSMAVHSIFKL